MKNYEEMSNDVFERINEYENKQKRKKKIVSRTFAAVCPALILTAAGVGIWKSGTMISPKNNFTNNPVVELTTAVSTENSTKSVVISSKTTTNKTSDNTVSAVYVDDEIIAENNIVDDNIISDEILSDVEIFTTDTPIIQPETEQTPTENTMQIIQPTTEYIPDNEENGGSYMDDMLGFVYINGELFMQPFDWSENYTLGEFIGKSSEFDSNYKYDSDTYFYYAAEDKNVILVKLFNGGQVILVKTVLPDDEKIVVPESSDWACY